MACFLYGMYKETDGKLMKFAFFPAMKREIFLDKKAFLWYTV